MDSFTAPSAPARWTLKFDGAFLLIVGALAMVQEARGHFLGSGPLAHLLASPYTIGGFEAHGLAAILGVLLLAHAGEPSLRRWHRCGLAIHLLLGGANLAFWSGFVALDMLAVGVVTTIVHVVLVTAHAGFLARPGAVARLHSTTM